MELNFVLKGQYDDIQESASLEGYRCKDKGCSGFSIRQPGTVLPVVKLVG